MRLVKCAIDRDDVEQTRRTLADHDVECVVTPTDEAIREAGGEEYRGSEDLEELEEELLGVLVVVRPVRGDLAAPVVAHAQQLELALDLLDVLLRPLLGVGVSLHGRVLRGQAEAVKAHRVQHLVAVQALVAREAVAQRVVAYVAHVHGAAGVREHLQAVEGVVVGLLLEDSCVLPCLLPFLGDCVVIHALRGRKNLYTSYDWILKKLRIIFSIMKDLQYTVQNCYNATREETT